MSIEHIDKSVRAQEPSVKLPKRFIICPTHCLYACNSMWYVHRFCSCCVDIYFLQLIRIYAIRETKNQFTGSTKIPPTEHLNFGGADTHFYFCCARHKSPVSVWKIWKQKQNKIRQERTSQVEDWVGSSDHISYSTIHIQKLETNTESNVPYTLLHTN